ncbi:hypothetical protein RI367_006352 [Sorochytrium milnesiophthora]
MGCTSKWHDVLTNSAFARASSNENVPPTSIISEVCGDLHFISPECAGRTNRPIDPRSDIYSLGMLVHAALGGSQDTNANRTTSEIIHECLTVTPLPLSSIVEDQDSGLTASLQCVFNSMTAKRSENRIAICAEAIRKLDAISTAQPLLQPSPVANVHSTKLYGRDQDHEHLRSFQSQVHIGTIFHSEMAVLWRSRTLGGESGFPISNSTAFADILQVTTLKRLSMSGVNMSGSIPAGLALLQNLEYLDLSSCQFSGPVPTSFQNLSKLRHLELRFNSLQSPLPDLSALTNLHDLGINQFSEDLPAWLWKMVGLSRLYAYGAGFTGQLPDDVSKLSGLVTLNLGANKLTGPIPAALFNLKNLRFLDLQYNQLTGSLPFQVGQLSDLYSLDLSNNTLAGPVPATLNNNTSIGSCSLQSNMFSCRERDLDPASICEHGLEQLPYCSGASSLLPPATVAAGPNASGNTPALQISNVSPAVYACLPVLFLLGAAIAWVAASRRYRSKASMTHPSTSPKDQEMAVQPKHVHDDAQSYYLPEHVFPAATHLTLWQSHDGESGQRTA